MDCQCAKCVRGCQTNPGWMTPNEAEAAIQAGLAPKLMRDWLEPSSQGKNRDRIYLLCPASVGCEADDAPDMDDGEYDVLSLFGMGPAWEKGRCTLLTNNNRCLIHASGFKPIQCRTALMCRPAEETDYPDNYAVVALWDTDQGRAVVARWQEVVSLISSKQ